MNICIIGIGSNINPDENISRAIDLLKESTDFIAVSTLVRTKPIGITNQSDFVNGAAKLNTNLSKEELLTLLKSIEDRLGRDRTKPKFGPRTIDLDIVIWNDEIIDDDYYTRDFLSNAANELGFIS